MRTSLSPKPTPAAPPSEPDDLMIRPAHLRRLLGLIVIFAIGFVALGGRLVLLQVINHERYRDIVGDNTQRIYLKQPRRGDILDANGNQLATSVPVKRLLAGPTL